MAVSLSEDRARVLSVWVAVVSVLMAIGITTTMDATGLTAYSALPLFPLLLLFWYLGRFPAARMGFTLGRLRAYGTAVLQPLAVLGTLILLAFAGGAVDISNSNWRKAVANGLIVAVSTVLVAIITEEGFFRGWLWCSLSDGRRTQRAVLAWTSIAFAAWHISAVTLHTGFDLPVAQIPVFLLNAAALGAAWGLIRARSGSIFASSLSHGIWNGIAYSLFGFGSTVGALGIRKTAVYGPESGLLGLTLNILVVAMLYSQQRARLAEAA